VLRQRQLELPDQPQESGAGRHRPAVELLAVTAAALVIALALPVDVVVFGVLVVGVAHVVLEVRYVVGRHPEVVQGTGVALLQAALLAVVGARLLSAPGFSRNVELAAWTGLLLLVLLRRFGRDRGDRRALAVGCALLGGATALAVGAGPIWFLLLAHLHNFVPAVFLWQWSGRALDRGSRRLFRLVVGGWSVVIPVLLLATPAAEAWAGQGSAFADRLFGADAATKTVAPGSWVGATSGERLLVAFAFAQLVHYAVWIWFLPRHDPATTAAFAGTRPGRALQGWRLPALVVLGTAAVVAVAAIDYRQGRTFYGSLGGYHAYLEYPILLGLLVDSITRRRTRALAAR
jgi:hypothetical protein